MKANELRIGNLVKINNELLPEVKNEIYKVYGLNAKFDLSFPNSSGVISLNHTKSIRIYSQFDEFIEPIPFTKEWLVKFGFEKAKHSHGYDCYIKDGFDFDIVSHGRYWVLAIYTDESCTDSLYFAHGRFEYVHQFQNLYFALTGEELTIQTKSKL